MLIAKLIERILSIKKQCLSDETYFFIKGEYEFISLFKQLNEQIDQVIKQIYNDMLQQIKQDNLKYNQILELAEYINELNLTQNSTQDIVNNLQQSIMISFNAYFNKTLKQRDNEAYQVEMIRGNFIIEFLQQCSLPQKELQLQNCKHNIALYSQLNHDFQADSKNQSILISISSFNFYIFGFKLRSLHKFKNYLTYLLNLPLTKFSKAQRINQDIESTKNMIQIIANLFGDSLKIDNYQ
ncbi:unnamed protein product [Paramecium primaurelia]|uniref:Uncharacterized protein n=1 Tax=Paramecium primaurelia TaxID=5886 RepID=A0A8S1PAE5_PARPR|nr:unnamed protein product [Paramecium primaurelia]